MVQLDANQYANIINSVFKRLGGAELEGLEGIDGSQLAALSQSLSFFGGRPGAMLSPGQANQMIAREALRSLHRMAAIASAAMDPTGAQSRVMRGFCGNNSHISSAWNRDGGYNSVTGAEIIVRGTPRPGCFDPLAGSVCGAPGYESVRCGTPGSSTCVNPALSGNVSADAAAQYGGMGGFFEDKIFMLMIKIVEDAQKKIEERLNKLQQQAENAQSGKKKKKKGGFGAVLGIVGGVVGACFGMPQVGYAIGSAVGGAIDKKREEKAAQKDAQQNGSQESRNIEFEKIKFEMQKLSQMQQALSNILNTMDELAKSAIRAIKAG